ncbi:hypothetical protein BCR39DRAFT_525256 [Naematelia encephala]|uniref:NUA/TPR/MLP1-2-like domain-containing protein n=1 Tax=Naematelia encephala TaxID=71784 RepID=A0A1Y2BB93_9TREE|nr:hypothetical protein BCR39DRAFT_525256 [Naematelia encephala]
MSSDPSSASERLAASSEELPNPSPSVPPPDEAPTQGGSAEDVRRQVEQEQALLDAQDKIKSLEVELASIRQEKQRIEGEWNGAVSTTDQMRTQLSTLQSSYHKTTSELAVLQTRVEAIEGEKRELLDEIERLQQRSNRSTQELYALRAQKTDASQKIAHLDVEVSELRMAAESAKFNEERSTQALQAARTEILNISKSSADIEERFGLYRVGKQAEISQLQVEHDSLVARLTAAENSYHSLQRTYNDQSRRLAEAHSNIAALTSAAAAHKANTSMELHRLVEENRVLEKRGDDARAVISEREAELERLTDLQGEKEKVWEDKWKKEERARREAEKRAEDLKIVVERLAMAGGEGNDLSPAAALAGEMRQTGKSYTQFYTDYTIQEGKLRTAENEVARLTSLLDEISQDISEKKPLLDEQAAEHAHAIDRANALAAELASALATRDARELEVRTLKAEAEHHAEEVRSVNATADDLARQVHGLLRQLAIRDDPSLASQTIDGFVAQATGDIITDHLVEFRSIRSLQEQNQKLLKLTRSLMSQLNDREIRRATADSEDVDTGASLDQATETISKLHTQLLDAQKKINEASRERDFFSKLLAKGEGLKWSHNPTSGPLDDGPAPHQQTIDTLRAEIDVVKHRADAEINEARELATKKAEAAGVAEVERAKAEAKATLLEEQRKMLNDTAALQKQDTANLETQLRQLQASISQAHNERRAALEELASKQAETERLRNEAANIRAEKDQLRSAESRLQSDFRTVQSERAKLQQLIENLSGVNSENEKTRAEERIRLNKRIDDLQREATALRTQIEEARAATRAAEQRAEDFDKRLAAATEAVRAEKDAAEALAASRATEITNLQTEVQTANKSAENFKSIGLNWKKRTDTLHIEKATWSTTLASKDQEIASLNQKVENLTKELEGVKQSLSEAEEKLQTAKRADDLKEATVSRLQSELAAAKKVPASATAPATTSPSDEGALASLRAERDDLQKQLTQAQTELETAKSAAASTAVSTAAAVPESSTDTGTVSVASKEAELAQQLAEVQSQKADLEQRYDANVRTVNRANQQFAARNKELTAERVGHIERIEVLEKEIVGLKAQLANASQPSTTTATDANTGSQASIEEAVKAAVSAREAELAAEHNRQLEEAKAAVKTEPTEGEAKQSGPASIPAETAARIAALEKERDELKAKVSELELKVKQLEKQARTAEISRKTLERQKADAETRLKRLEEGGDQAGSTPTAKTAGGAGPGNLSVAATEFKPSTPASSSTPATAKLPTAPTGPAAASPPIAPSAAGAAPARGAARGRARATIRGANRGAAPARANSVLSAVNATLAQASTPTPTPNPLSPTGGTKRPLPEEGEISEPSSSAGGGEPSGSTDILARLQSGTASERGARVLKRPRGAGTARGGPGGRGGAAAAAAARRPSQGTGTANASEATTTSTATTGGDTQGGGAADGTGDNNAAAGDAQGGEEGSGS